MYLKETQLKVNNTINSGRILYNKNKKQEITGSKSDTKDPPVYSNYQPPPGYYRQGISNQYYAQNSYPLPVRTKKNNIKETPLTKASNLSHSIEKILQNTGDKNKNKSSDYVKDVKINEENNALSIVTNSVFKRSLDNKSDEAVVAKKMLLGTSLSPEIDLIKDSITANEVTKTNEINNNKNGDVYKEVINKHQDALNDLPESLGMYNNLLPSSASLTSYRSVTDEVINRNPLQSENKYVFGIPRPFQLKKSTPLYNKKQDYNINNIKYTNKENNDCNTVIGINNKESNCSEDSFNQHLNNYNTDIDKINEAKKLLKSKLKAKLPGEAINTSGSTSFYPHFNSNYNQFLPRFLNKNHTQHLSSIPNIFYRYPTLPLPFYPPRFQGSYYARNQHRLDNNNVVKSYSNSSLLMENKLNRADSHEYNAEVRNSTENKENRLNVLKSSLSNKLNIECANNAFNNTINIEDTFIKGNIGEKINLEVLEKRVINVKDGKALVSVISDNYINQSNNYKIKEDTFGYTNHYNKTDVISINNIDTNTTKSTIDASNIVDLTVEDVADKIKKRGRRKYNKNVKVDAGKQNDDNLMHLNNFYNHNLFNKELFTNDYYKSGKQYLTFPNNDQLNLQSVGIKERNVENENVNTVINDEPANIEPVMTFYVEKVGDTYEIRPAKDPVYMYTLLTEEQKRKLESAFHSYKYATAKVKRSLAKEIGVDEDFIKKWFEKRRCKFRKSMPLL